LPLPLGPLLLPTVARCCLCSSSCCCCWFPYIRRCWWQGFLDLFNFTHHCKERVGLPRRHVCCCRWCWRPLLCRCRCCCACCGPVWGRGCCGAAAGWRSGAGYLRVGGLLCVELRKEHL